MAENHPDHRGERGRPLAGGWVLAGHGRYRRRVAVVAVGALGTLAHRGFGRVPFSVPPGPWYTSDPFYVFWDPRWPSPWLVVALAAAAGVMVLLNSGA